MNRISNKNHAGETDNSEAAFIFEELAGTLRDIQQVQISCEIEETNDVMVITLGLMISLKHSLKNWDM